MALIDRLMIEALRERGRRHSRNRREVVEIKDFGEGIIEILVGAADERDTPAIGMELTHSNLDNPATMVMSCKEVECVIKELQEAVASIPPAERLRQRRRKGLR